MAGSSCAVGDEDALAGVDLEAQHRRRVEIREEDQHVVLLLVAAAGTRSAPGTTALLLEPLHFVGAVCALLKIQSE